MSFVTWKAGYIARNDREPGPFDSFYGGQDESQAQIAALQSERDALRELLWLNHAQYTPYLHAPYGDDGEMQCCGIDFKRWSIEEIQAHLGRRLSTSASGESKCLRCGSHLRHITFPIGANLPYHPCDDAWHVASGEPARKP